MEQAMKQEIALFRFQVISRLISLSKEERGAKKRMLDELSAKEWEIPGSGRTYLGRSTILQWLSQYEQSGRKLESLYPKDREDIGRSRAVDPETELGLITLRKQHPQASIPSLMALAREQKIIPLDCQLAPVTLYRILKRHNLVHQEGDEGKKDRRRFEAELPNDLWQSDCLHGPLITLDGKKRKAFLFAFIDDHSRLIPNARFYSSENLTSFMDCLLTALCRRGLPRKLYVDNGPSFRASRLQFTTASLGIALIHATPYEPEGKGKIERWFRTVRMQFLSLIQDGISLEKLNSQFNDYVHDVYHQRIHSATGETPLARYTRHLTLVRPAPKNIRDYFRIKARRIVEKDRTVSLNNTIFEAPINMIGNYIDLLYHESDPHCVEAFYQEKSLGFLVLLDKKVNSRIRRERSGDYKTSQQAGDLHGGSLF